MKRLLLVFFAISIFTFSASDIKGSDWKSFDQPDSIQSWQNVIYALSISSNGDVGGYYQDMDQKWHGFRYDNLTTWTTVDVPGAVSTCVDVTFGNVTAGYFSDFSAWNYSHGFIYDKLTTLTVIDVPGANWTQIEGANNTKVIGYFGLCPKISGFVRNAGVYNTFDFPGATYTNPCGIDTDSNDIVGDWGNADENWGGFLYENLTTLTLLEAPAGTGINNPLTPTGISGGNIIGYFRDTGGYFHGFLYNRFRKTWRILDYPGTLDAAPHMTDAIAISGMKVVGGYQNATSCHNFIYTIPPFSEPAISNINPASGPPSGGTHVTITGTEFMTSATLTIGGNSATNVSVLTSSTITAITPAGKLGPADIVLTNTDASTATLTNGFTYVIPKPKPVPAAMLVIY